MDGKLKVQENWGRKYKHMQSSKQKSNYYLDELFFVAIRGMYKLCLISLSPATTLCANAGLF